MKTKCANLALAALSALSLLSCSKEKGAKGITYQVRTSGSHTVIAAAPATGDGATARTQSGSLHWTSGYASVREIEFEAKSKTLDVEYKSESRQKIDLFAPLSSLGVIEVPDGTYKEIKFEVEVQPNGTEDAFQLNGQFTDSRGAVTPVLLKVNAGIEIESDKDDFTVSNASGYTAITTWSFSRITAGVSESMLRDATLTNGVIEISATSNNDIYAIILQNLKGCGGVEVD